MSDTAGGEGDSGLSVEGRSNADVFKGALAREHEMISGALDSLDRWDETDQSVFKRFFGEPSDIARAHATEVYGRMLALNESYSPANFQVDPLEPAVAYVDVSDPRTITVSDRFFGLGQDSQAATLIHEMSHFNVIGATMDFTAAGDVTGLLRLTQTRALGNAQSYAVYGAISGMQ